MEKLLPVAELRGLLSGVAEHGARHLSEVETDLHHTSYLLAEAIEKLGQSFITVHQLVSEQQQYMDTVMEQYAMPTDVKSKFDAYEQQIGAEVNKVVTGLQFHDLTTQLNARTVKRVDGLRNLLNQLLMQWDEMVLHNEHEEIDVLLRNMLSMLTDGSSQLEGGLRQPVKQQDMSCGEIDLF